MFLIILKCLFSVCLVNIFHIVIPSVLVSAENDFREGYFNGSSNVRLATPLSLQNHIGLSFKSCVGGELFEQHTNGNVFSLSVQSEGLIFYSKFNNHHYEVKMPVRLLNNNWHVVNLEYKLGNLTLSAGGQQQVIANKTLSLELLNANLSDKNSVLHIGNGFVGCILEGPSIIFDSFNLNSNNVLWGPCVLNSVNCQRTEPCGSDICMSHGYCLQINDQYECMCSSRYSGIHCEIDEGSPCNKTPCKNNGKCIEDPWGNFTCLCDYAHSGMNCELDSGGLPCDENPCKANASCRVSSKNEKECLCPPGYSGSLCEIDIDECLSNPCRNGGICISGPNSYNCNCGRTGYTGERCEININECQPINPCLNEGICFDNYGGYTCQCLSGFGGHNCELNLNECKSEPCQNGGHCIDKLGTYECTCRPGFIGKNCQTNINECNVSPFPCGSNQICIDEIASFVCVCKPGFDEISSKCIKNETLSYCGLEMCQNNGTCLTSGDYFHCQCLPGFKGKNCEINECLPNPCFNGGTCYKTANGHICVCSEEYFGDNCQFAPNPCLYSNCLNKGVCHPKNEQEYYCDCPAGFDGLNCEINVAECVGDTCFEDHTICPDGSKKNTTCLVNGAKTVKSLLDPCASSPCNRGKCLSNNDLYTCVCDEGITGVNCETDIDECDNNRTICNFGICYNIVGGYQCYCLPGYAGNHCDIDVDECLSKPCLNNAICENRINNYQCICQPGYTGVNCEVNIDECFSNPCRDGGTCVDEVAGFTCYCLAGLTGAMCETNIDDCESLPCEHGGICVDGINSYKCNCDDTGFFGTNCEQNIDDCLSDPCTNDAKCIDLVKGYECKCHSGYFGLNCEIDINECESSPCQNGGTCLERSNRTLYEFQNNLTLPIIFSSAFDYKQAFGYECVCVTGTTGVNCEKDINECDSNPCHFGSCKDEIGRYKCECEDGYEGEFCEIEINECERYKPCINGTCIDRRNDYYCSCVNGFGGKNCSVELTGCVENNCANNGLCLPYLENEVEHKFNCSCPNGFHGKLCEKGTTMSLGGSSYILVNTTREEGYDIQFRFKTTLPNGLLAIGKGLTFYILELVNGRLNLQSSLLNKLEGVFVGSGLNNSKWQKVFVAINASHLVLAANEEQTIYPISLNEANTSHTSFQTTYLGGTSSYLRNLIQGPSFIGCTEDVQVNGEWVLPQEIQESSIVLVDVEVGCPREEQCAPNPCHSGGHCTDLWSDFNCTCERPYLGHTCQYNFTPATFGHENITSSYVTVLVNETTQRTVRNAVDISMFIRTRQDRGLIFYFGTNPDNVTYNEETFIIAQLEGGELRVRLQFGENQESYSVGGVKLDNGYSHLIQVVRNSTLVQFRINNTEYFKNTIGASDHLEVDVLYLGGLPKHSPYGNHKHDEDIHLNSAPHPLSKTKRQIESLPISRIEIVPDSRMKVDPTKPESGFVNFKGIIQDVQISGSSQSKWVVEFFPLKVADLEVPATFGEVIFDKTKVLEGEISDDTCKNNPCLHNGSCTITWNDYSCKCPRGYKGKSCQEMEFCQLQDCPTGSQCRNLDDGYECVANVTLRGTKNDLLSYNLVGLPKSRGFDDVMLDSIYLGYRTKAGGTILHVSDNKYYLSVSVNKDEVTVIWKLDDTPGDIKQFSSDRNGNWTSVYFKMKNGKLLGGFTNLLDPDFTVNNFPVEAWRSLLQRGKIYVGGVDVKFKYEEHFPFSINSVNVPPGDILGGYYKGCLGEIRIGNLLLPFYTPNYLYNENFTAKIYFALEAIPIRLMDEMGCILCYEDDCLNGGICLDPNTTYACECPLGFAGSDCSKDIDWCEGGVHCENGATCVDGITNYTCTCPLGYTGVRCEINIDECASNPCVNGECIDQAGSFKCLCKESYSGERCENLRIITCADRPCKRGSSCTNAFNRATGDNYTCTCLTGYVGRHCDVPFCLEKECVNGICDHMKATPTCICNLGYEGQYCEEDVNECISQPCQNDGHCVDKINNFECECKEGYEGVFCENDVDECKTNETLCGDGFCNNTFGSYKCICNPKGEEKMCGLNCNISDPCTVNPCENNGLCIEKCTIMPLYECRCTEGYVGFNCTEVEVGESASPADIAIIVGPIIAFLILAGAVGLSIFIVMARKKRATRGTYSPSQQEYCNPRVEMDNVLKPPPEERLI